MGGIVIISENTKNYNSQQLEQTIIYLKAELAKYKNEVNKVQSDYYYSLAEILASGNEQLTAEKNELTEDLFRLNKELIKRTSDYKERIHSYEIQSKKQLDTLNASHQTINDLSMTNRQLTEIIQKLKVGLDCKLYNDEHFFSLHSKIGEYKTTIEQLEYRILSHIQAVNKPLQLTIDNLSITSQERFQSDQVKQHLLQDIAEKNCMIEKLQHELLALQVQHDKLLVERSQSLKNATPSIDTETLVQVDHQIKKILGQSLEYEEQLAVKILALQSLEHKLDQLTVEIDEIKIFGVSGQISKVEY